MQADFSIELGPGDETLEFPWADESGNLRYYDLKRHPDLVSEITEAQSEPALKEFLSAMNAASSGLETAKCDTWSSAQINPEEEIFGTHKFGSYVDLLFADEQERLEFPPHENLAQRLCKLLKKAPELPASAEFIIRCCHFHQAEEIFTGFYLTFYLFGYGEDETQAHQRWVIALKLVENAIRQARLEFLGANRPS